MKKTNHEKTKKAVVFAGLLAAGALAVTGICLRLHQEEPVDLIAEREEEFTETLQIDVDVESPIPSPTPVFSEDEEPAVSTELAISTQIVPERKDEEPAQSLQEEPVKTEDQKPAEPPTETVAADNPDTPPVNREIPAQATPQPESNPGSQNGTVQGGKIYIDGFGWIDYNGGATEVVQGNDIYENGNTVGIMD